MLPGEGGFILKNPGHPIQVWRFEKQLYAKHNTRVIYIVRLIFQVLAAALEGIDTNHQDKGSN
jgi:hypothetical protein